VLLCALWCGVLSAAEDSGEAVNTNPLWHAITTSKPVLDMRLRSESVDQQGIQEDASAVTLRARVGFETGSAWHTSLLVDADLIWALDSDYNSTINGKTQFPVVADPEGSEINRLQITNTAIPDTKVVLGRQRIILDDHRFVGNVGWRQNEQTFDALRITNGSLRNFILDVAYVSQVNRVFSSESPVGRYTGDTYIVNGTLKTGIGNLTGFAYLLDLDEAPTDSSRTVGLRLTGEREAGAVKLAYTLSYASQQEYAANPLDYSDDYGMAELVGTWRGLGLGAGVEVLEGNGIKGFTAPLGTLHKFQGWADKFLTTPPNGIEDRYATLSYGAKGVAGLNGVSAALVYHRFDAQRGAADYGSELDFQLQATWHRLSALAKLADFDAQDWATDTRKYWLQVEYVW
jgi:hypothetical protein